MTRDETSMGRVLTLGYAVPDASERLAEWMADSMTLLVDVRLVPRSRWYPQWNKAALVRAWATRYTHQHGLGNVNYRDHRKPIELRGPRVEEAIAHAAKLLYEGYSLVLLCVCADEERCHRTHVARLIAEEVEQLRCPTCQGLLTRDDFGGVCQVAGQTVCFLCYTEEAWRETMTGIVVLQDEVGEDGTGDGAC